MTSPVFTHDCAKCQFIAAAISAGFALCQAIEELAK